MKEVFKSHGGSYEVSLEVTQEKKDKVFKAVVDWLKKQDCTSGEYLQQSDNCIIDAPVLLSDIVDDILKFDVRSID